MPSVDAPPDEPGQPPALTNSPLAEAANSMTSTEQVITPFTVAGGVDSEGNIVAIDYAKLTRDFGATPLTQELIDRFERVTGKKAHRFMRRGIVISHRELNVILDRYEKGEEFFLYTGRGPSSDSMHVGHATPFDFTKYLQETFDCPLVIQITDDEKFMHSEKISIDDSQKYAIQNIKDIIGLGFDVNKTFILLDTEYMGGAFYKNVIQMAKRISINQIQGTFGFGDSNNIGEYFFCAIQSAPSFATSFPEIFPGDPLKVRNIPCLIPCAIDQDPYFRQTRDNAAKLKYQKPSLIHSVFLPALQGAGSKMSASDEMSAIFLSDTAKKVEQKVGKALSGGQDDLEQHRKLGGRTEKDVPYQYLSFFMEDDDELEKLRDGYEKGEILTGEMKKKCAGVLKEYVAAFQERRAKVTDELTAEFMRPRTLKYGLNPNVKSQEAAVPLETGQVEKTSDGKESKNQQKKAEKLAKAAAKKAEKANAATPAPPPAKKELTREHAETTTPKGHSKSMSVGRVKLGDGEAAGITNGDGKTTGHSKKSSISRAS